MNILAVVVLSVILLSFALVGLAIRILIKKNGQFPNTHVSGNIYLKSQGITCAQSFDKTEQKKALEKVNLKDLTIAPK